MMPKAASRNITGRPNSRSAWACDSPTLILNWLISGSMNSTTPMATIAMVTISPMATAGSCVRWVKNSSTERKRRPPKAQPMAADRATRCGPAT